MSATRRSPAVVAAVLLAGLALAPAGAGANDTRSADAVGLVRLGVAVIKAQGAQAAYSAINRADALLSDNEHYLVIYTLDGRCLAHGANPAQVGRDFIDWVDFEGRPAVRERLARARSEPGGFWQSYRATNFATKKVQARLMYCERLDDTAVCAGELR